MFESYDIDLIKLKNILKNNLLENCEKFLLKSKIFLIKFRLFKRKICFY